MDTIENINAKQLEAANPDHSVWVSASAGSGKTTVLVKRLLNLLLRGVDPSKILCITYTKNGAVEMKSRINYELSKWAVSSDDELTKELKNLTGRSSVAKQELEKARTLFAKILDETENFRILTIHSFCQQIMKRFPIEAGIMPNFQVADEITASSILKDAQNLLLQNANETIKSCIKNILINRNSDEFFTLLGSMLSRKDDLLSLRDTFFGVDEVARQIFLHMGFDLRTYGLESYEPDRTQKFISDALDEVFLNYSEHNQMLKKIADISGDIGKITDKKNAEIINLWLCSNEHDRQKIFGDYSGVFLKKDGTVRTRFPFTKAVVESFGEDDISELVAQEQRRIQGYNEAQKSLNIADLTTQLLMVAYEVFDIYHRLKKEKNLLDYDDLILHTKKLLGSGKYGFGGEENPNSSWVNYKLDSTLNHLLLDEAQDTSRIQWDIISSLTSEFFSGLGRDRDDELKPTIFVVGDEKQSIFKFQGAAPEIFDKKHNEYEQKILEARHEFRTVMLENSFRTLPRVLEAVDCVFNNPEMTKSISKLAEKITHKATRKGCGRVEVWDLYIPKEKQPEVVKKFSFEEDIDTKVVEEYSDLIAKKIKGWIDDGRLIPDKKNGENLRKLQYRDIMILVRNRSGELINYILKAFNKYKIPCGGLDRLRLGDNLIVNDLVALGRFTLFPDDDLNLATLLKTPLFGVVDEEELLQLCRARLDDSGNTNKSLWQILGESKNKYNLYERLVGYLELSKNLTPLEFFLEVLNGGGRDKILQRFGVISNDIINEFLNLLNTYEINSSSRNMMDFINYFQNVNVEIKRDTERSRNEVCIMTVHGSKGLESPVVIMPDADRFRSGNDLLREGILFCEPEGMGSRMPIYKPAAAHMSNIVISAKEAEENELYSEYLRLLYVAMTRAKNELYIGGHAKQESKKTEKKYNSWHAIARNEISKISIKNHDELLGLDSWVLGEDYIYESTESISSLNIPPAALAEDGEKLLKKLDTKLPEIEKIGDNIINPSIFYKQPEIVKKIDKSTSALMAGNAIHKLLEILPSIPKIERKAALNIIANDLNIPDDTTAEAIGKKAMDILENPDFSEFFDDNSAAEVPIYGSTAYGIVSGQIDRLALLDNRLVFLDFKNTSKKYDITSLPRAYRKQMELYATVLGDIYPDKKIEGYILLTNFNEALRII